jgi:hypothetical protein
MSETKITLAILLLKLYLHLQQVSVYITKLQLIICVSLSRFSASAPNRAPIKTRPVANQQPHWLTADGPSIVGNLPWPRKYISCSTNCGMTSTGAIAVMAKMNHPRTCLGSPTLFNSVSGWLINAEFVGSMLVESIFIFSGRDFWCSGWDFKQHISAMQVTTRTNGPYISNM